MQIVYDRGMRSRGLVVAFAACGRIGLGTTVGSTGGSDGGDGGATGDGGTGACAASYVAHGALPDRYRTLMDISFAAAGSACAADGTSLLVIDTAPKQSQFLSDNAQLRPDMWAGVERGAAGWIDVHGNAATFLPWAAGEPSTTAVGALVVMRTFSPQQGMFFAQATDCSSCSGINAYCDCVP